jgi:hypothetical protein
MLKGLLQFNTELKAPAKYIEPKYFVKRNFEFAVPLGRFL